MVRKGLPASIVKKYGVSKKAWAVFRRRRPKSRRKKIKKTKVRTMARRRRRRKSPRRRRRRSASGLRGLLNRQTLLLGVGAGASGALGGYVKKYAPQIPNNYAEAAAGVALVMFGGKLHPALRTIGKGVMIKVIGDFVETNVMPKVLASSSSSNSGW